MKRKFTFIASVFMMVLLVSASGQEGTPNLLVNGDFEEGLAGWSGGPENLDVNNWFPYSGENHFTLKSIDAEGGWQIVNGLTSGATYELSGYLRNNASVLIEEVRAGVRNYGGDELSVAHVFDGSGTEQSVQDEWTPFSIEFALGEENTSVEVFIQNVGGNNYCYADAFVLAPAGVSTSIEDNSIANVAAWVDNGSLTVTNAAGGELSLLNLTGASVLSVKLTNNNQEVGVSQVPAGIYIVSVLRNGKIFSSKVIK